MQEGLQDKCRYMVRCSYNGTRYHGWQAQPDVAKTIQGEIEAILSKLHRGAAPIVGCGRTDAGVHARDYVFHFDTHLAKDINILYKLNRMSSDDLYFSKISEVTSDFHARYDAISRSYQYIVLGFSDPFRQETSYYFPQFKDIDQGVLNYVASLFIGEHDFSTFCKTNTDVSHKWCTVTSCEWSFDDMQYTFDITANRFLRGMIRLIVGVSLRAAIGMIPVSDIEKAFTSKERITQDWSAPARGLFLDHIIY